MDDRSLWKLMHSFWIKFEAHYDPAIQNIVSDSEMNMREWMMLLAALTFEPEETTPSHLMVRGPYTSSEQYLQLLENIASAGYLQNISNGRFQLNSKGREAIMNFIEVAREAMVLADPLHSADSQSVAGLFERLVKECLNTPPPPNTWSITLSNKLMPSIDPPMPFIEQSLSCLMAYRDDAHLASWRTSGLSATAMESLTLIWRDQVHKLDQLTRKLSFRGHPEKVYMDSLAELRSKGYISGVRNVLRITDDGKLFRDQVEATTDQYFFKPWSCLTKSEKGWLGEKLSLMGEALEN